MSFIELYEEYDFKVDGRYSSKFQATQGDEKSRGFLVRVVSGGQPVSTSGMSMKLFIQSADGGLHEQSATRSGERFSVGIPSGAFDANGTARGELVLYGSNQSIMASDEILFHVRKSVRFEGTGGIPETKFALLEKKMATYEDELADFDSRWQQLIDETTGKDVVSAPEIIDARDGEVDLKTRIDKDHQEVTAQLAQTTHDYINVKTLGVKGNGISDDTLKINESLNSFSHLYFPSGEYVIDSTIGIVIPSNKKLFFSEGVKFTATNSNSEHYELIKMHNVEKISLKGKFEVIGDRKTNTSISGEWGHGISIKGGKNIYIENPTIKDCWGDGIYIGSTATLKYSENIHIVKPICDNNRRQGISLVSGKNITIDDPILKNTNGTIPEAGLDIEPNEPDEFLENIKINNPYTENNSGGGVLVALPAFNNSLNHVNILINNHTSQSDSVGQIFNNCNNVMGTIKSINPALNKNKTNAITSRNWNSNGVRIDIVKPTIVNNNQIGSESATFSSAILVYKTPQDSNENSIGNIHIYEPSINCSETTIQNYLLVNNVKNSYMVENISFINPTQLKGKTTQTLFILANKNIIVEDKNELLLYKMTNSITLNQSDFRKTITNENMSELKNLTLNKQGYYPDINIVMVNNSPIRITPDSTSVILPYKTEPGQTLMSSTAGSRITLRRINDTTWHVLNVIGDWV